MTAARVNLGGTRAEQRPPARSTCPTMRTIAGVCASAALGILLAGLFAIDAVRAQTPSPGTFAASPVFSESGLAAVVFNGGTPAQLESASLQVGATGAWVQDSSGTFRLLIVGGPAFLSTTFSGAFPNGLGITAVTLTGRTISPLKYAVMDRFGRVWFCDPDFYPIARQDEQTLAKERFAEIQADGEIFNAILGHLGYLPSPTYTAPQMLSIYRDWKMLRALVFDRTATGYHFNARFTRDEQSGTLVDGTIDRAGRLTVATQTPAGQPVCPICLVAGTRIDTPVGTVPVEGLREGMPIWTVGENGERVLATVIRVGSMTAPNNHEVVRLSLDDGRDVTASPGHPLADGRAVGTIVVGDAVDGARVRLVEHLPYANGTTYDVLPSGRTGTYWANGVALASTIAR